MTFPAATAQRCHHHGSHIRIYDAQLPVFNHRRLNWQHKGADDIFMRSLCCFKNAFSISVAVWNDLHYGQHGIAIIVKVIIFGATEHVVVMMPMYSLWFLLSLCAMVQLTLHYHFCLLIIVPIGGSTSLQSRVIIECSTRLRLHQWCLYH